MCPREPLLAKGDLRNVQIISYLELVVLMAATSGHQAATDVEEASTDGHYAERDVEQAATIGGHYRDGDVEEGARTDFHTPSTQERNLVYLMTEVSDFLTPKE